MMRTGNNIKEPAKAIINMIVPSNANSKLGTYAENSITINPSEITIVVLIIALPVVYNVRFMAFA